MFKPAGGQFLFFIFSECHQSPLPPNIPDDLNLSSPLDLALLLPKFLCESERRKRRNCFGGRSQSCSADGGWRGFSSNGGKREYGALGSFAWVVGGRVVRGEVCWGLGGMMGKCLSAARARQGIELQGLGMLTRVRYCDVLMPQPFMEVKTIARADTHT